MVHASPEDMLLTREADLIYQCRACSSFFREFANYLKHKQIYCTTLAHKNKRCRDDWNSMLNKLGFDFGSDESAASDSEIYDDNTKLEVTDSEMEYFDPNLSEVMEEEDNKETIRLEITNNKLKRPDIPEQNLRNSKDDTQPPEHKKLLVEPHCSEIQTKMIKIEPVSPEETDNNRVDELFFNVSKIKTEPVTFDESSIFDEEYYYSNTFNQTESQVSNIKKSNQNVRKRVSNNRRSLPPVEEDNVCQFCTEQFSKASDLRYHKRSEHYSQVLTYKCFICYAHLLSIPKLEKHISKTHNMDRSGIEIETEVLDLNDPRLMAK